MGNFSDDKKILDLLLHEVDEELEEEKCVKGRIWPHRHCHVK